MTKTIDETISPNGYLIRTEKFKQTFSAEIYNNGNDADYALQLVDEINELPDEAIVKSAYNLNGVYIGSLKTADIVCNELGICPEPIGEESVCSLGKSKKDGKWYGWSHRAIAGFEKGSKVSIGDCAYNAPNKAAFITSTLKFFTDDRWFIEKEAKEHVDANGKRGVMIKATYTQDVPNKSLRGTQYTHFEEYPEKFGKGEWVAESDEDVKQMAIDFAMDVR